MSLVQAVEQMEEEIAKLKQERDELAALGEVMRDALRKAHHAIKGREHTGFIQIALSITPSTALREIRARVITETCFELMQKMMAPVDSLREENANLREELDAVRKAAIYNSKVLNDEISKLTTRD